MAEFPQTLPHGPRILLIEERQGIGKIIPLIRPTA
jgi:hypothetical protein